MIAKECFPSPRKSRVFISAELRAVWVTDSLALPRPSRQREEKVLLQSQEVVTLVSGAHSGSPDNNSVARSPDFTAPFKMP